MLGIEGYAYDAPPTSRADPGRLPLPVARSRPLRVLLFRLRGPADGGQPRLPADLRRSAARSTATRRLGSTGRHRDGHCGVLLPAHARLSAGDGRAEPPGALRLPDERRRPPALARRGLRGRGVLGRYGSSTSTPPADEDTVALYRCLRGGPAAFRLARRGLRRRDDRSAARLPAHDRERRATAAGLLALGRAAEGRPRLGASRTIRYGGTATLVGVRRSGSDGGPAAGATVLVLGGESHAGGSRSGRRRARTGASASGSRPGSTGRSARASGRRRRRRAGLHDTVSLLVRAGLTLKAKPRSVRFGRTTASAGGCSAAGCRRGASSSTCRPTRAAGGFKTVRTRASGNFSARIGSCGSTARG